MKKIICLITILSFMVASLAACGSNSSSEESIQQTDNSGSSNIVTDSSEASDTVTDDPELPDTVTITHKMGTTEVEYQPQRIFVLDAAALDTIETLGLGEYVVGVMEIPGKNAVTPEYLEHYYDNDSISILEDSKKLSNTGRKNEDENSEPESDNETEDLEDAFETYYSIDVDLIIAGTQQESIYDLLCEIAPTIIVNSIELHPAIGEEREDTTLLESVRDVAEIIGKLYGMEDQVENILTDYETRAEDLHNRIDGNSGVVCEISSKTSSIKLSTEDIVFLNEEYDFVNLSAEAPEELQQKSKTGKDSDSDISQGDKDEGQGKKGDDNKNNSKDDNQDVNAEETDPSEIIAWMQESDPDCVIITGGTYTSYEDAEKAGMNMGNLNETGLPYYFLSPSWSTCLGGMTAFGNILTELETIFR